MINKEYRAYLCRPGMSWEEACRGLADFMKTLCSQGLTPIKLYVALRKDLPQPLPGFRQRMLKEIEENLPGRMPAFTAVVQPPVDNSPLLAEIWCVEDAEECRFFKHGNLPQVSIERQDFRELWTSGFMADSFGSAFESVSELLESERFSFDDVFRQWNYVGNILEEKSMDGKKIQNYQHFNDIRAIYYQRKQDRSQYPAATGIGMDCPGLCIDLVAVKTSPGFQGKNLPLRSPVQKNAYQYNDRCLVGESLLLPVKNAPLFERGRCMSTTYGATAMISGTASIKGEETVAQNDIRQQTGNTLRFISELLADYPQARCRRARLYVKRGEDPRQAVRLFTSAYPQDCVCTCVFADICRENLLIEIEADWCL